METPVFKLKWKLVQALYPKYVYKKTGWEDSQPVQHIILVLSMIVSLYQWLSKTKGQLLAGLIQSY
jgi:hypothetical protein